MTCKICHGEKRVAVGWSQDLRRIAMTKWADHVTGEASRVVRLRG